ncbi:methionine aminotransferase [Roseivirga sp. BDSF3-8]|uniref:methionine aminotransferase n=1 Tax=Roseivirga sp. BDSF3-8 TaxID=3241598 RepID=UPI0035321673
MNSPDLKSKLPDIGTSIFSVMSAMAQKHEAINLSQGFPDFEVSPELIDRVAHYMKTGHNQYAPMPGVPALLDAISQKISVYLSVATNPSEEITVTAGATEALYAAISAFVRPGDEVIVLEPAYDSYGPAIRLQGGRPVYVSLRSDTFRPDWEAIERACTDRTAMMVINTPHNPTGSVWEPEDILRLEKLAERHNLIILSDEVYEHIVFDGKKQVSVLNSPSLRARSVAVFSFGKTFHATGWKVGYAVAPPALTRELRKMHQYLTFAVNRPVQHALADYLQEPANYMHVSDMYEEKRNYFAEKMKATSFKPMPCQGTYFAVYSYEGLSDKPEREMAEWLTKEIGVATIPLSPFFHDNKNSHMLRFCFAKTEQTLAQAAERLCRI